MLKIHFGCMSKYLNGKGLQKFILCLFKLFSFLMSLSGVLGGGTMRNFKF